MYKNESKNGFSIIDIIVKIIFAGLFIFLLIWLFQKKVPNMTPFYSNVFRENIKYMQDAGESYFTDDKMPKNVGDEVKLTLSEMIDKKLIIPFVDEDGNSCNQYNSYVSIKKEEDESYTLKTNLVCNKESDYTIKVLGCHTYCKNQSCNKTCSIEKIVKYQFKKLTSKTTTKYSCPTGYKLDGKYCLKTVTAQKAANIKVISTSRVETKDANVTVKTGSHTVTVDAIATANSGTKTLLKTIVSNNKVYVDRIVKTTPSTTRTETYSCPKTEKQCTNVTKQESYTCNKTERKCNTSYVSQSCGVTCSPGAGWGSAPVCTECVTTVPVETCHNVTVPSTCTKPVTTQECHDVTVQGTCTREVTVPGTTTYSCPVGSIAEGSGSSLKCYKVVKEYSCPAEANLKEGSGSSLKCYKVTNGTITYICADSSYKLNGTTCSKVVTERYNEYSCDNGYTLNGTKCNKTVIDSKNQLTCDSGYTLSGSICKKSTTEKIKATAKKSTSKYYIYKWSTEETLRGWTKTGKSKIENGKEICE